MFLLYNRRCWITFCIKIYFAVLCNFAYNNENWKYYRINETLIVNDNDDTSIIYKKYTSSLDKYNITESIKNRSQIFNDADQSHHQH